jgi:acyl carrier protein
MNDILTEQETTTVFDILQQELGVPRAQLVADARLKEDLGADSLTLVQITMALEEQFELSVPDEEWAKVSTVKEVFDAVADILGRARSA